MLTGWLQGTWQEGRWVARRLHAGLLVAMVGANVLGAGVVFVLGVLLAPRSELEHGAAATLALNGALALAYLAFALPAGVFLGTRRFRGLRAWLASEEPPSEEQQLLVLRGPFRLARIMGGLWATAVLVFGAVNFAASPAAGITIAVVVAFGGITTCAVAFLLAERVLREAAARVLEAGAVRRVGLGVGARAVLAWALVTGVPVLGIIGLGVASLAGVEEIARDLDLAAIALGGIALVVGLLGTLVAARTTADPVMSVRNALGRVQQGDLDVRVPVYDGTELGQLQAGFNRMVAELRERERLRDLFGRHVGEDVAQAALERGVDLGGEAREVAVLFVDLVGSTALAARRAPAEVVDVLNRFFAVVVDSVESCGGWVNKFEGDAALAVFGAPAPLEASADRALSAARELAGRLAEELPGFAAGIGVSGGTAVAGNIGAAHRFEYTVIGDPVNEAARLTELAKDLEPRVAASASLVEQAGPEERERWRVQDEVTLRGRGEPTCVMVPA